jgi:hypothetical protein
MSRSLARVVDTPSYADTHLPLVDAHELSVTTFVPSRFRTATELMSRVHEVRDID